MEDPNVMQEPTGRPRPDIRTPARNRWFFNKLLDAYHMQLETDYFNHKRWLLNRLVLGSGVVAGLDVLPGPHPHSVTLTPGLAIDWHGREILVPKEATLDIDEAVIEKAAQHQEQQSSRPQQQKGQRPKPQQQSRPEHHHVIIHLELCYKEIEGGPVPADPGGDCETGPCVPGTIYEKYTTQFVPTPAREVECGCEIPDLLDGDRIDHGALARWVTRHRTLRPPANPCIALANIRIHHYDDGPRHCRPEDIDIQVRPVVYSNDLLLPDAGQPEPGAGTPIPEVNQSPENHDTTTWKTPDVHPIDESARGQRHRPRPGAAPLLSPPDHHLRRPDAGPGLLPASASAATTAPCTAGAWSTAPRWCRSSATMGPSARSRSSPA